MKRRLFQQDDDFLDPLYDTIKDREELGLFYQALNAASFRENAGDDFVRILRKEKSFTVFAPTNDSIRKPMWDEVESLIKRQEEDSVRKRLRQIVGQHIVRGKFTPKEIEGKVGKPLQSLANTPLLITMEKKNILLNKTRMQQRDGLRTNNGILYFSDGFIN
jgi:uncharacterized surface protein with fasciclin (FAS1) repeats